MVRTFIYKYRYLLYILLLLPLYFVRDYTPANELKYISIIEEALREGNWFTFYNHGDIYADKPPLYFWLLMLSRLVSGDYYMWLMGLFSLVPAVGVMAVMDRWMKVAGIKHNPLISGLLLGTTGYFLGSALVLRMDILMCLFIVLACYTFYKIYSGHARKHDKWLLPVYIFLAVFSKGAMGILFPLVAIVVFLVSKGEIKTFGRYFGWKQFAVLAGLCALWFVMIFMEGGSEYLNNILFKQTVGRGVNSFHHKEPVWYYIPRIFLTFAPWCLLYAVCLVKGVRKRYLGNDSLRFMWTFAWTGFVMMSLISSKIDIYLLPIYPFVVYLSSALLGNFKNDLSVRISVLIPATILALLFPVSFFITSLIPLQVDNFFFFRLGLLVLMAGSVAAIAFIRYRQVGNALLLIGGSLLLMVLVSTPGISRINGQLGFREITEESSSYARDNNISGYYYYKFYTAPNMDVYLGVMPELVSNVETLDSLDRNLSPSILFLREKDKRRSEQLRDWLEGRDEMGRTGDYSWIIIGRELPGEAAMIED